MQPSWLYSEGYNPMFDTESLLMVSIFRKAYPPYRQPRAAMFLHHFRFEIDRTCRMLKLLGLVEEAASTLGSNRPIALSTL
jgi:hypothetical protein